MEITCPSLGLHHCIPCPETEKNEETTELVIDPIAETVAYPAQTSLSDVLSPSEPTNSHYQRVNELMLTPGIVVRSEAEVAEIVEKTGHNVEQAAEGGEEGVEEPGGEHGDGSEKIAHEKPEQQNTAHHVSSEHESSQVHGHAKPTHQEASHSAEDVKAHEGAHEVSGHEAQGHESGAHHGGHGVGLKVLEGGIGVLAGLITLAGIRDIRHTKGQLQVCHRQITRIENKIRRTHDQDQTQVLEALLKIYKDKARALKFDLASSILKTTAPVAMIIGMFVTIGPVAFGILTAYTLTQTIHNIVRTFSASKKAIKISAHHPHGYKQLLAEKSHQQAHMTKAILSSVSFVGCSLMLTGSLLGGIAIAAPISAIGFGLFLATAVGPKLIGWISRRAVGKDAFSALEKWHERHLPSVANLLDLEHQHLRDQAACSAKAEQFRQAKLDSQALFQELLGKQKVYKSAAYRVSNNLLRFLKFLPQLGDFVTRSRAHRFYQSSFGQKLLQYFPTPDKTIKNRREALIFNEIRRAHSEASNDNANEIRFKLLKDLSKIQGRVIELNSPSQFQQTIELMAACQLTDPVLKAWEKHDPQSFSLAESEGILFVSPLDSSKKINFSALTQDTRVRFEQAILRALDMHLLTEKLHHLREQEATLRSFQAYL